MVFLSLRKVCLLDVSGQILETSTQSLCWGKTTHLFMSVIVCVCVWLKDKNLGKGSFLKIVASLLLKLGSSFACPAPSACPSAGIPPNWCVLISGRNEVSILCFRTVASLWGGRALSFACKLTLPWKLLFSLAVVANPYGKANASVLLTAYGKTRHLWGSLQLQEASTGKGK